MSWILLTLMAAFMQAWRNALQSRLSEHASVAGVTLARFIAAAPLAGIYLLLLYLWQPAQALDARPSFWIYVIAASLMQILATALMVRLFKLNNYAVGAGLAKSEALVAAVLGMLFFGSFLSPLGWLGVLIGALAVMLLSGATLRQFSPATAVTGLACGSAFALTSLWVREASLNSGLMFPHSAAWVLFLVLCLQCLVLLVYLILREPGTLDALWRHRYLTLAISVCSCIGSIGWFGAMSLQQVPYVKTLGQVEVFFTILISVLWLRQPVKKRDGTGLILIALAAALVMWD